MYKNFCNKISGSDPAKYDKSEAKPIFNALKVSGENFLQNMPNFGFNVNLPRKIKIARTTETMNCEMTVANDAPQIPNLKTNKKRGQRNTMFKSNVDDWAKPNKIEWPSDWSQQMTWNKKVKNEKHAFGIMYWKHISEIFWPAPNHSTTGFVIGRRTAGIKSDKRNDILTNSTKTCEQSSSFASPKRYESWMLMDDIK